MTGTGQVVLVVDADEAARTAVTAYLRAAGIDAIDSEDGFEAVGRIEAGSYAAILLDVREVPSRVDRTLPMGFGVLEHIHRNIPDMLDRVIVMTANAAIFVTSPWYDRVGGFIRKPVDNENVVAMVRAKLSD
ncbi:MAG TPA: response regulator [Thermoanaerobaculia bacterium]|nr:response regulator [Thermoanaerobaculia bacterium]